MQSRAADGINAACTNVCGRHTHAIAGYRCSGRFRGGPRGPGPPLRESKKLKKGPINGKCRFEVTEKKNSASGPPLRESKKIKKGPINGKLPFEVTEKRNSALLPPPTESRRLSEFTNNFCYYPPPPPPLNVICFLRSRKNSATTPPPLNLIGFWRSRRKSATTPPH